MFAFCITIFWGAFLLFLVQPLIARFILPWFGGGPAIWTTCMLFFQLLLLGGYAYAHFSITWLKPRQQVFTHLILLALAVALLPITPGDNWKPADGSQAAGNILVLLIGCLGLPYLVLSATGPLLQAWFAQVHPGVSPYRLYSLSNIGSLLALLIYPFYLEPNFARQVQANGWSWGLGLYAIFATWCGIKILKCNPTESIRVSTNERTDAPPLAHKLLWFALPACGVMLLLAITNKLCQDIAVVPFLWVLPLSFYLLSFIISFDSPRWYQRAIWLPLLALLLGLVTHNLYVNKSHPSITPEAVLYISTMFVACMVCHGEVFRIRPSTHRLTGYYLSISAGGAVGGLFVALIAPYIFPDYFELHLALFLTAALALAVLRLDKNFKSNWLWFLSLGSFTVLIANEFGWFTTFAANWYYLIGLFLLTLVFPALMMFLKVFRGSTFTTLCIWNLSLTACIYTIFKLVIEDHIPYPTEFPYMNQIAMRLAVALAIPTLLFIIEIWVKKSLASNTICRRWSWAVPVLMLSLLGYTLTHAALLSLEGSLTITRSFYGVLRVNEYFKDIPEQHHLILQHGSTTHGLQFTHADFKNVPSTYYTSTSGVGRVLSTHKPLGGRRVAAVGLGSGTLATWGREGDTFRFYEINDDVARLATKTFTHLKDTKAKIELVMGDARLSMEREANQEYDVIILDAFSSDAIPIHLLTLDAFEHYQRHLKPDGVIVVHVSNNYLDLNPVVFGIAEKIGFPAVNIDDTESNDNSAGVYGSEWIILSRNNALIKSPLIRDAASETYIPPAGIQYWTDERSDLLRILSAEPNTFLHWLKGL